MEAIVKTYGNILAASDQRSASMKEFRKQKKAAEEKLMEEMIKNNLEVVKIGDKEITIVQKLSAKKIKASKK